MSPFLFIGSIILAVFGMPIYALVAYVMFMTNLLITLNRDKVKVFEYVKKSRNVYGGNDMLTVSMLKKSVIIGNILTVLVGYGLVYLAPITLPVQLVLYVIIAGVTAYRTKVINAELEHS